MRRFLAVVLAVSCVAAATPSFARGSMGHGVRLGNRLGIGVPVPRVPAMANRIPAPLAAPARAPVINGPISQPAFRGLTGIGQ
jgi:hypothetical protein